MNMEKVIQELDDSLKNQHCGFIDGVGNVYAVSEETIKNILTLLKKQEAIEPKEIINEHFPIGDYRRTKGWACGSCGEVLHGVYNYCSYCGTAVKWE